MPKEEAEVDAWHKGLEQRSCSSLEKVEDGRMAHKASESIDRRKWRDIKTFYDLLNLPCL